jgi:CheY-like chemotaxis protein
MSYRIKTVLLLDDNLATNFINKKFIKESQCVERVIDFQSGKNALKFLESETSTAPEIIFVDINMPIMTAWEFLEEYEKLENIHYADTIIILLSTSLSPADAKKAKEIKFINSVRIKPLSIAVIKGIIEEFFPKNN